MDYSPPPYIEYAIYSEVAPSEKLAQTIKNSLKDIPETGVRDEILYASKAMHLDPIFMLSVAQIESDFNCKNQTGQYKGLFQLSEYEFRYYGIGNIWDARDNAIAAAIKIATENYYFEHDVGYYPSLFEMYMIHQQGEMGIVEHLKDPNRLAWESMCATPEGKQKGEKWCKKAIWGNTLPRVKEIVKNVENFTSAQFLNMWHHRVAIGYLWMKFTQQE